MESISISELKERINLAIKDFEESNNCKVDEMIIGTKVIEYPNQPTNVYKRIFEIIIN